MALDVPKRFKSYLRMLFIVIFSITASQFLSCAIDDSDNNDKGPGGEGIIPSGIADFSSGESGAETYNEPCQGGATFSFDMDSTPMVVPYPNNIYTRPDLTSPTGMRVNVSRDVAWPLGRLLSVWGMGFLINALNSLDGFSTMADLYIPLEVPPHTGTFPNYLRANINDGIVLLVDDPESPFNHEIVPVKTVYKYGALRITPMLPLREKTHYALVATRKLKPEDGRCFAASASMRRVWNAHMAGQGDSLNSTLANLEAAGLESRDVLSVSEFTTLWATRDLSEIREILNELEVTNPPVLSDIAEEPFVNDYPADYYAATLNVPIFRNDEGIWERNVDGRLMVDHWEDIKILMSLPDPAIVEAEQPYPLIQYGQGLGSTMYSIMMIAAGSADRGYGMIAMDDVCHGERLPVSHTFDISVVCYLNLLNPLVMRDNIRETVAGKMWLARAAKSLGELDIIPAGGDGIPDFDVSNLYFHGLSMGTMHGAILTGIEENIDAYVMSSAGAKFTSLIFEGPFINMLNDWADFIQRLFPDAVDTDEYLFLYGHIAQHILDSTESANYLVHALNDPLPGMQEHTPYILAQSAATDSTVGSNGQVYFNRAAGIPQLLPYVWDVGLVDHEETPYSGSGFYQYWSNEHFLLWAPGLMGEAYRRQVYHFLDTHFSTGTPEIINPFNWQYAE